MKKTSIRFCLLFLCSFIFSQERFDIDQFSGFSMGGGGILTKEMSGGFPDIGFPIYRDDFFFIRSHTRLISGGFTLSDTDYASIGLQENIVIGTIVPASTTVALKYYGSIGFGASIFTIQSDTASKDFFTLPLLLEPAVLGGIEFLMHSNPVKDGISVFIELGTVYRFFTEKYALNAISKQGSFITLGGRAYY